MIDKLLVEMQKADKRFKNESIYDRELVRVSCKEIGLNDAGYQNKIIAQSQKISRGLYKFVGSSTKSIKTSNKAFRATPISTQIEKISESEPSFFVPNSSMTTVISVPAPEPGYVPFGTYKDVEKILKSRKFFPLYITGQSGNGKSAMVIDICAKHKIPMVRINCSVQSDEEKLIGSKTLENGDIKIIDGPIVLAMRVGALICLEEIDALDTKLALTLQGICEGRTFFFSLTGEYITPAPGFNIIGIGNTKGQGNSDGKYLGTNIQNSAFLERFGCTFEQQFPSQAVELKMVTNWMNINDCFNQSLAEALVKWTDAVRRTYADGGIEEVISTRRLNHIVVAYSIYGDVNTAIELCTNRFDSYISSAVRNLFKKIYVSETETETLPVSI